MGKEETRLNPEARAELACSTTCLLPHLACRWLSRWRQQLVLDALFVHVSPARLSEFGICLALPASPAACARICSIENLDSWDT